MSHNCIISSTSFYLRARGEPMSSLWSLIQFPAYIQLRFAIPCEQPAISLMLLMNVIRRIFLFVCDLVLLSASVIIIIRPGYDHQFGCLCVCVSVCIFVCSYSRILLDPSASYFFGMLLHLLWSR